MPLLVKPAKPFKGAEITLPTAYALPFTIGPIIDLPINLDGLNIASLIFLAKGIPTALAIALSIESATVYLKSLSPACNNWPEFLKISPSGLKISFLI